MIWLLCIGWALTLVCYLIDDWRVRFAAYIFWAGASGYHHLWVWCVILTLCAAAVPLNRYYMAQAQHRKEWRTRRLKTMQVVWNQQRRERRKE